MKIKEAVFICSNTDHRKCPNADKPEYAFIGRSNVGKSSLINMLTNNKRLAKISAKPGKTQLINHFLIDKLWYLVDLPGYGWAKVSKAERAKWEKMIKNYFLRRENLQCVFVLIDSRLDPQNIDINFVNWLGENSIPCVLVFTKTDKITQNKLRESVAKFKKRLLADWEEIPQYFVSSAVNKTGRDEILDFITNVNDSYKIN